MYGWNVVSVGYILITTRRVSDDSINSLLNRLIRALLMENCDIVDGWINQMMSVLLVSGDSINELLNQLMSLVLIEAGDIIYELIHQMMSVMLVKKSDCLITDSK